MGPHLADQPSRHRLGYLRRSSRTPQVKPPTPEAQTHPTLPTASQTRSSGSKRPDRHSVTLNAPRKDRPWCRAARSDGSQPASPSTGFGTPRQARSRFHVGAIPHNRRPRVQKQVRNANIATRNTPRPMGNSLRRTPAKLKSLYRRFD